MSKAIHVEYFEKLNGLVLKSNISSDIQVKFRLTLSRCLMPSYWKFAFLSKQDVRAILDVLPSRDVWLLGLAIGAVTLAPSSFRTAYAHLGDILITSKANVITRILLKYEQMFSINQQPMLDTSAISLHHVPALPKFFIPKMEYDKLSACILPDFQFFGPVAKVNQFFTYRENSQWIAIAFEGDCLYALRIVTDDDYKKSEREKRFGVATKMPIVMIADQKYAILCDDGALFGFH
jgi:hypothetical protein